MSPRVFRHLMSTLLLAVFGCVTSAHATDRVATTRAIANAARVAMRLKSAGLTANAPDLRSTLSTRLATTRASYTRTYRSRVMVQPVATPRTRKPSVRPAGSAPTTWYQFESMGNYGGGSWFAGTAIVPKGFVKDPCSYDVKVPQIPYKLTADGCGYTHTGTLVTELGNMTNGGVPCDTKEGDVVLISDDPGVLPFGTTPHDVVMTITPAGLPPLSRTITAVPATKQKVTLRLTVDSNAPFFTPNDFSLQASQNHFEGQGPRSSNGTPYGTTAGEDVLGIGVSLGPGYQVLSTKVVAAKSQIDSPTDTSPDNTFRGAKVKIEPSAGRLQTAISWYYGPYESISYTVEWVLEGPAGQRPLLIMPKSGLCDL